MNFHDMQAISSDNLWRICSTGVLSSSKSAASEKTLPESQISKIRCPPHILMIQTLWKTIRASRSCSEGKTTEIRRSAYSIQQQLDSPRQGNFEQSIVHLLSMQNYSGIERTSPLWMICGAF